MRFMIAGYGSIGRRHLHNLMTLGEQDVFLYRTGRSTLPAEEIAGVESETDLEAALARKPHAVIIANPTASHLSVAIPAARAGCHLLLEKPISHDLTGLPELKQALSEGGGQVLIGFQFRYHPGLRKIDQVLSSGELGVPLSARCEWGEYLPGWHPWEDYRQSYSARPELGGGVVLTLSHPLDYLSWFFGTVTDLWADACSLSSLGLDVEDHAEIILRFSSGVRASLHLDYYRRPPVHRLEITCEDGVIAWDNADGAATLIHAARGERRVFHPPEGFERNWLFLEEMRHFLAVCRGEAAPVCGLDDGETALRLALAALKSAQSGSLVRMEQP